MPAPASSSTVTRQELAIVLGKVAGILITAAHEFQASGKFDDDGCPTGD
jgi:hypothetical protein